MAITSTLFAPVDAYAARDLFGFRNGRLEQCGAFRGNGDRMLSTFASLATFTEYYGTLDAVAGSSSGGIVSFIYESIALNPALAQCGQRHCSEQELQARLALALKSVEGYLAFLEQSPEIVAFSSIMDFLREFREEGIEEFFEPYELRRLQKAFWVLLTSMDLRNLISPEVFRMLSLKNIFHIRESIKRIMESSKNLADMDYVSPELFFRSGLLNMKGVVTQFGRMADFYAGYGPADQAGWLHFYDSCAPNSLGKTWKQLEKREIRGRDGSTTTCGDAFESLLANHQERAEESDWNFPHRVDDRIGANMHAFNSTSALVGEPLVEKFKAQFVAFRKFKPVEFRPGADAFRVGYWGNPEDLAEIARNKRGYPDRKTALFHSLGQVSWGKAIYHSASEPGLSSVLVFDDETLTSGGWMDPHPTLMLKNLGCERVVYFTRQGEEASFGLGVSHLIGLDKAEQDRLFSLEPGALEKKSSAAVSIAEADAVWCTDWNSKSFPDVEGLVTTGYTAVMQVNHRRYLHGPTVYPRATRQSHLKGCQIE